MLGKVTWAQNGKCYIFYSYVESREKRRKEEVEGEKEADEKIPQMIKKTSKKFNKIPLRPVILTTIYYIKMKLVGKI